MRRELQPGAWDDGHGGLHIDIDEMLTANGYANSPENRAMMLRAIQRKYGDQIDLLVVETVWSTPDEVDEAQQ
jgi:hypothetical protein